MYLRYIRNSFSAFNWYHMVRRSHRKVCLSMFVLFCTQLTFDLILRPRDIISMDVSFYSIMPSKVKIHVSLFCLNGLPTTKQGLNGKFTYILLDYSLTVKAAPHECVIRTNQP